MQQATGNLITPAEYARLRGLNRSTISRQVRNGTIPVHDGRVDPVEADAARDRNLSVTRREQAAERKAKQKPAKTPDAATTAAADDDPGAELRRLLTVSTLRQIVAPAEVLSFAAAALDAGCSPLQTYALAGRYSVQPALAVDGIDAEDLYDFQSPARAEWCALLGPDFDFEAADVEADRISE